MDATINMKGTQGNKYFCYNHFCSCTKLSIFPVFVKT